MRTKVDYNDVIEVKKFPLLRDERGFFSPTILKNEWVQSNFSYNEKALTFRGMHYQEGSFAQQKTVQVYSGKILDIVKDIRPESNTFGAVDAFYLEPGEFIVVPRGFAHGFVTLEPSTIIQYFVDNDYSPKNEGIISWKTCLTEDIEEMIFKLRDELNLQLTISDKDDKAESWKSFCERVMNYRK